MVRLKDIAERASVSVMTVSKVMRDAADISAATKVRVRKIAEEMGYVPDSLAQGLRNRTTKCLGLVVPSITNPIFGRMVFALEEGCHANGYQLVLTQSLSDVQREELVIRRLISRRVDGIFIAPVYRLAPTATVYEELRKSAVHVVLLGPKAAFCDAFQNVESDDRTASYNVTQHLLSLGHRRIAFLMGPFASPVSQERLDGYKRALRDGGVQEDERLIFKAGSTIEEGSKAALQMLNEWEHATAVQCFNDLVAIGAAEVLLKQGFKIPEQISITGFGNTLISEYYKVPLTTVRQPKLSLGAAAIENMMGLIKATSPEPKRLAAELLVRDSTAKAAV